MPVFARFLSCAFYTRSVPPPVIGGRQIALACLSKFPPEKCAARFITEPFWKVVDTRIAKPTVQFATSNVDNSDLPVWTEQPVFSFYAQSISLNSRRKVRGVGEEHRPTSEGAAVGVLRGIRKEKPGPLPGPGNYIKRWFLEDQLEPDLHVSGLVQSVAIATFLCLDISRATHAGVAVG
jgi:hypothetical protein